MLREIHGDVTEALKRRIAASFTPDPLQKFRGPVDGRDHTLVIERLQEIIEGLDFEGADRVLVVRRDEHDCRRPLLAGRGGDGKPVEVGHLDVQKHQVGGAPFEQQRRIAAVGALVDARDGRDLLQHAPQPAPRRRLVVNDDRAHDR